MTFVKLLTFFLLVLGFAIPAQAQMSMGAYLGSASANQDDINTLIKRANTRESGITTSQLTSAMEISGFWSYRFSSSMIALHFRPSYYWVTEKGSALSGGKDFEYSVSGFTFFPMLRFYLLENSYIKFYGQFGLGWGIAIGEIEEDSAKAKFSGSNMGNAGGIGAEFCFFSSSHCMALEGNFRYLPFERMTYSSGSGTFAENSLDYPETTTEAEMDNRDVSVSLSGVVTSLGYTYYF